MQHILDKLACDSVEELVEVRLGGNLNVLEPGLLYIARPQSKSSLQPYLVRQSPRVGLFLTKWNTEIPEMARFVYKPYRFFTQPNLIRKGQHYMVLAFHEAGKTSREISDLIRVPENWIKEIISLKQKGRSVPVQKFVGRRLTDEETCSCFGAINSPKESTRSYRNSTKEVQEKKT